MLQNLPVLMIKKLVILPYQEVRIELNIELSKKIVDISEEKYDSKLLVICANNTLDVSPTLKDLPTVGVFTKIKSKIELPNGNYRIVLVGLNRVKINNYRTLKEDNDIVEANVKRIYVDHSDEKTNLALSRTLKDLLSKYIEINPTSSNSIISTINNITDLDMLVDIITNFIPFDIRKRIEYMNTFEVETRAKNLIKDINLELEVTSIETRIDNELRESYEKEQREFLIRQKIDKLNAELGISDSKDIEIKELESKIKSLPISDTSCEKLMEELKRYSYTSDANPDSSVLRNYLQTVISLPWGKVSKDETDLKKVKRRLDNKHFGLDEVKYRILEFLAIKKNNPNVNAPIICLVGPPGVGKTTFGLSLSESLNRKFYKISVGGLNDPSELIGHKRTYLGSSPGKIIQGIKKCGTSNPVILIDEVDKMISDFKGDPAAVLLDILDQNQNHVFVDNYIEEPFDLSKIIFILTANDLRGIPSALKDRLEIININSYTEKEKIDIAKKYLLPIIIKEYGTNKIKISDEVLSFIISSYTKESGARNLERILRKIIRYIIINGSNVKSVNKSLVIEIMGPVKYENNSVVKTTYPGSVTTLGVTPLGGIIIPMEAVFSPGDGKLKVTGNVEDITRESANIAYTYILSNLKQFGIDKKILLANDININALTNMKKDGTSGGVAFVTSIVSLLLDKKIDNNVAFSGEITLHGDITKVGGIKEKLIGAYNFGYKTVYIPLENKRDLESIPDYIKNNIEIKCVDNYKTIFEDLFKKHK